MAARVARRGHHGDLRLQNLHDVVVLDADVQAGDLSSLRGRTDDLTVGATELFHLGAKMGGGWWWVW